MRVYIYIYLYIYVYIYAYIYACVCMTDHSTVRMEIGVVFGFARIKFGLSVRSQGLGHGLHRLHLAEEES